MYVAFFGKALRPQVMNISSVIVSVRPERVAAVRAGLGQTQGVEVHAATADGKFIVTIETESDGETVDTFERLGRMEGVMSVAMVYHQFESDPENAVSVQANPPVCRNQMEAPNETDPT